MYFDICVSGIEKVLKIRLATVMKYRINILVELIFQDKIIPNDSLLNK